jgi:hypothetical protein
MRPVSPGRDRKLDLIFTEAETREERSHLNFVLKVLWRNIHEFPP